MEIIEQIRKEYQEINWCLEYSYTTEKGDDKTTISAMTLYYDEYLPLKFFLFVILKKLAKH